MRTYTVLAFQDPDDPNIWIGCVPVVPSAMSEGQGLEHTLEMTQEALELVLEDYVDTGMPLPADVTDLDRAIAETRERFEVPDVAMSAARVSLGVAVQHREAIQVAA
jgi:predicted RNase H-like HicB family nuclease